MSAFSWRNQSQPDVKSNDDVPSGLLAFPMPTLGRRLLAWSLEVAILTASIAGPLYVGGKLNEKTETPSAELTPALKVAHHWAAQVLGLSPRSRPRQVNPLTNVVWSASLGLPLILAAAHLYSMSRYGKSWPKQWLGVQVLTLAGQMPGWRQTLLREGIGKWGGPLAIAYVVWNMSGAFPNLFLLVGLGAVALVGESLTGLGNRPRRPWHDWLAGTCVVDQETGAIIRLSHLWEQEADDLSQPYPPYHQARAGLSWADSQGGLTSVIFNPIGFAGISTWPQFSRLGIGLGAFLIVGSLAGVGSYHLLRHFKAADNSDEVLYVNLVSTLTDPTLDTSARRAAVLALGNLPDQRVTPLLVDLIAQTEDPQWLDALQQALVTQGAEAIPYLRRLNQSLTADLAMQGDAAWHRTLVIRLQTVNRILTKLLLLEEGDRPYPLDLSALHLGYLPGGHGEFTLVLKKQDLSGIRWQGSVLTRAQLQGARFYSIGADRHRDTYDDKTADLSGADLTGANLTGANLSLSRLVGSGLLRSTLNRANLTLANLTKANLEQAALIQADLSQAQLVDARLSRADLTAAQLSYANLEGARLSGINAAGVELSGAVLRGVSANSANLTDANLTDVNLEKADLSRARLQNANLHNADLSQAILKDADLRDVKLQGADLTEVDLAGAILTAPKGPPQRGFVTQIPAKSSGSKFAGVDFSTARNLEPEQLTFICAQAGIHPACDFTDPK